MRKTSSRFVKIFGSGYAVPGECVLSDTLDAELKLRPGTIERISGVRQRYFARGEETAAKLAARACRAALSTSGFTWGDIDCLIAASGGTMHHRASPIKPRFFENRCGGQLSRDDSFDNCSTYHCSGKMALN